MVNNSYLRSSTILNFLSSFVRPAWNLMTTDIDYFISHHMHIVQHAPGLALKRRTHSSPAAEPLAVVLLRFIVVT